VIDNITIPPVAPMLLDARAAARLCGVGLSTFWRLHAAARTPAPVKLGGRTLWRADELAEWCKAGCPARDRWHAMKGGRP
jgi:predicted DNA-binding transcriptional regulator AlpA